MNSHQVSTDHAVADSQSVTDAHSTEPPPAGSTDRMDWLFRHSLKSGIVNPLLGLVRRYRATG